MPKFQVQAYRTAHIIETADFEVEAESKEEAAQIGLELLNEGDPGEVYYKLGDSEGSTDWEMDPNETREATT